MRLTRIFLSLTAILIWASCKAKKSNGISKNNKVSQPTQHSLQLISINEKNQQIDSTEFEFDPTVGEKKELPIDFNFPKEVVIDLLKNKFEIGRINHKYQLISLYDGNSLQKGCYTAKHIEDDDALIVEMTPGAFDNAQSFDKKLSVSFASKICIDDSGTIYQISFQKNQKTNTHSIIDHLKTRQFPQNTALNLTVVPKGIDALSSEWFKRTKGKTSKPQVQQIKDSIADATYNKDTGSWLGKNKTNLDNHSITESENRALHELSDDDLFDLYDEVLVSSPAGSRRSRVIEQHMLERFEQSSSLFAHQKNYLAFRTEGNKRMIQLFKEVDPNLANAKISVTSKPEFTQLEFSPGLKGVEYYMAKEFDIDIAHNTVLAIDHDKKFVFVLDSLDNDTHIKGWENTSLLNQGYTYVVSNTGRQSSAFGCNVFCARDFSTLAANPRVLDDVQNPSLLKQNPGKENIFQLDVVPAELLVSMQSMSRLKSIDEIHQWLEGIQSRIAKGDQIDLEDLKVEFYKKYLNGFEQESVQYRKIIDEKSGEINSLKGMFEEAYKIADSIPYPSEQKIKAFEMVKEISKEIQLTELQKKTAELKVLELEKKHKYAFFKSYYDSLDAIYDSRDLQDMFFRIKVGTESYTSPREAVDSLNLPDSKTNESITMTRAWVLSNLFRSTRKSD